MKFLSLVNFCCISFTIIASSCEAQVKQQSQETEQMYKHTNDLIGETSPYLLQHAHNPVNWMPWGNEALDKAQREDKLILVSIGYSACHWCHVMEHESFEDDEVAKLMNDHFVCIKVDREERPDVDQIYMTAVQMMKNRGGWPLNCFTLPNGKPVYGGTYFPKEQWIQILVELNKAYREDKRKFEKYADQLTNGIQENELFKVSGNEKTFDVEVLNKGVYLWKKNFDTIEGGVNHTPKFPLPNNYLFLLRYGVINNDQEVLDHVRLTLIKMAEGGIYDQIGGGFSRYSTDAIWKVPHFEKMLYDNAQLISLYSEAYQYFKDDLFKVVVEETIEFTQRELLDESNAFYSALDADSDGEEGKFYVWNENELMSLFRDDFTFIKDLYHIDKKGVWEQSNYILMRNKPFETIQKEYGLSETELKTKINRIKKVLLKERSKRIRPGLDDKTLTSWNALMIKGLCDAYKALGNKEYLKLAEQNAQFILYHQLQKDGSLFHSYKQKKSTINGFLEDYSFTIEAFVALFEQNRDEMWLQKAELMISFVFDHFENRSSKLFFFTSDVNNDLIIRSSEVADNVIPASNSSFANGLFRLGEIKSNMMYKQRATEMIITVHKPMKSYLSGYSNWGNLMLHTVLPQYEIIVAGKNSDKIIKEFNSYYIPNALIIGEDNSSVLNLFEQRFVKGETLIYVCVDNACKKPVYSVKEALKLIRKDSVHLKN